ncbi:MAG: mechanosensitive ion channel domain-containing protein [Opitutaceae bacterium]|jgi:small conductance mechanosensitive channel
MSVPIRPEHLQEPSETVASRLYSHFFLHESSLGMRILLIAIMAVLAHVAAKLLRRASEWILVKRRGQKGPLGVAVQRPKFDTGTRLLVSGIVFLIYFVAIGLILQEFGFSLTAYLASASVLGLAISFGSQGLVQDIVIGLTLVFWNAMDVNDMVEIEGTTTNVIGRVQEIGMRFTKIVNFYNQKVFIPNRTIGNVSRFPHGGVDAYADPQVPVGVDPKKATQAIEDIAMGMWAQFGAIILSVPVVNRIQSAQGGHWSFVRVHFKIWPGQGTLIEVTFRQEVVKAMRLFDPRYADWQVPVTYRAGTASKLPRPSDAPPAPPRVPPATPGALPPRAAREP